MSVVGSSPVVVDVRNSPVVVVEDVDADDVDSSSKLVVEVVVVVGFGVGGRGRRGFRLKNIAESRSASPMSQTKKLYSCTPGVMGTVMVRSSLDLG